MKKRKNLFIFLLVLIYASNGYSQNVPVSIPSPEAASLGIVANIPVSLHTGQVNVSIPLLEVKCGNYTLPVNLSYNASGIMPDIRPTWVGQNWNLNVGGVITRRVKDLPDEFYFNINGINGNFWE